MAIRAPGFRIRSSYEVAFSPDEQYLATIGRDVVLWSVAKRARLRSTRLLSHPAYLAFAPSSSAFAAKNTGGEIVTCATSTADPLARFVPDHHDEGANPVYLKEDLLVDASWSGEIRLRASSTLWPHVVLRSDHAMVTRVSPAQSVGVYAFLVKATHAHPEYHEGADCVLLSTSAKSDNFVPFVQRRRFLKDVALAPSGRRIALRSGNKEHCLEVIDTATGRVTATTAISQGGTGWALSWSPDCNYIVLVEREGFSFREAESLREVGWLPSAYPSAVDFAKERRLVALGDWQDGLVVPWPGILERLVPRVTSILT